MTITGSVSGGTSTNGYFGVANNTVTLSSVSLAGDVVLRSNSTNLLLQSSCATGGIKIDTTGNTYVYNNLSVAGNIGIRTTKPTVALDVVGALKVLTYISVTNTPILRIGNVYGLPYNYLPTVELSVTGYTYSFDFGIPTISGYIFNSNSGSGGQCQQGIQGI